MSAVLAYVGQMSLTRMPSAPYSIAAQRVRFQPGLTAASHVGKLPSCGCVTAPHCDPHYMLDSTARLTKLQRIFTLVYE